MTEVVLTDEVREGWRPWLILVSQTFLISTACALWVLLFAMWFLVFNFQEVAELMEELCSFQLKGNFKSNIFNLI